ncbi:MAG: hypothetical protein J6D53_03615 [Blautia sp.]|nr:hypothetical protein [Blautia sp.]
MANAKNKKASRLRRRRMPVKTSINLVMVDEKKINLGIAIPAILLIIFLAGVFSKYMVYDRLMEMSRAEGEVVRLRNQYDTLMSAAEELTGVEDTYAHYTISGMTASELSMVDRVKVLELVESVLPSSKYAKSWNVSGNILTIEVTESTLSQQNDLAKKIEKSPIVDSCIIMTANKNETKVTQAASTGSSSTGSSSTGSTKKRSSDELIKSSETQYLKDRNSSSTTSTSSTGTKSSSGSSTNSGKEVWARFLVYLKQPDEAAEEEATK